MKTKPLLLLSLIFICSTSWALDPVAPKSERAFGRIRVKTPLPSDTCEIKGKASQTEGKFIPIPCADMTKVLIGDYELRVKLQNTEWSKEVSILPTEFTEVNVVGFGNIKVSSPNPNLDSVEVLSLDGRKVREFFTKDTITLPTGTYNLKIKTNKQEVPLNDVVIFSNTTREVSVSF
ncbi:MAG: T9SS type A sorting domain-containing protein [Deltaproteobacteria bacterium]|nr:T9SS type A sorting domain-containing protein [Deltaproteobacteria bacterium]